MECPLTRTRLVYAGLGHHSGGAPIMRSAGECDRLSFLSPACPGVPTDVLSRGIATSLSGSVLILVAVLVPGPAVACSRAGSAFTGSFLRSPLDMERKTSEVCRPARSQKYQQLGRPE